MNKWTKVPYQVVYQSNDGEVQGHFDCEAASVPGAMSQVRKMMSDQHGLMSGEFRVTEVYRI